MNWKGLLMRATQAVGLVLFLPLVALSQQTCGPIVTNPPPTESPAIFVTKASVAGLTATAYVETCYVAVFNAGDVTLQSLTIPDSARIAAYIPSPATSVVTSAPAIIQNSGNPSLVANGSWTGLAHPTNANLLTLDGSDSLAVGQHVLIRYILTITHNGTPGTYTNRAWASGTSPGTTVVTDSDFITLMVPAPTQSPRVGIAKYFGAVTGTAPNFAVPCTLVVQNVGNVTINRILVTDRVADAFAGISGASLTSITNATSARGWTLDGDFDGTSAHDTLHAAVVADSLRLCATGNAATDTLSFIINFNAGTGTTFSNQATARAANLANTITFTDLSEWGSDPDPSTIGCNEGMPNDPGEDSPSQWSIPTAGTATASVWIDKAGPWEGFVPFPEGEVPGTQITSGTGLALRDSLSTSYATQYEPGLFWEDGSLRTVYLYCIVPFSATYDVIMPGAAQTGAAVTITEPMLDIRLNGTTYDFSQGDAVAASPLPANGRVCRRVQIVKTDGGANFEGHPGALEMRLDVQYWANGVQRCVARVLNQRPISATLVGDPNIWDYFPPSGGVSRQTADWYVVRAGSSMRARFPTETALPSGNQSEIHVWHSESYDHPNGEGSDYGGLLRAGEPSQAMFTTETDPEPPVGWYTPAYMDLCNGAVPFTQNMPMFQGPAYASADSLPAMWELRIREMIASLRANTPYDAHHRNVRDLGRRIRLSDAGTNTPTGNTDHIDMDQYESDKGLLLCALGMVRNESDSCAAHPTLYRDAYDLAFTSAFSNAGPGRYWVTNYGVHPEIRGASTAHTAHASDGIGSQGRGGGSGANPVFNYQHGQAQALLAVMTRNPVFVEACALQRVMINYWYSTRTNPVCQQSYWCNNIIGGEGRSWSNFVGWCALSYALTDSVVYRDIGVEAVRGRFGNEQFDISPGQLVVSSCGTSWYKEKSWMWALGSNNLRNFARELRARNDDELAVEMEGYLAEWLSVSYFNSWSETLGFSMDDASSEYPVCTPPGPSTFYPTHVWQWFRCNDDDSNPSTPCVEHCNMIISEQANFWNGLHANNFVNYAPDAEYWKTLWRAGLRHMSDDTRTHCLNDFAFNQSYLGGSIILAQQFDCLRKWYGTLDNRPQGSGPTVEEDFFD